MPAGELWNVTVATPLPASAELLVSATVPRDVGAVGRRGDGARRVRVVDEPCVGSRGRVLVADGVACAQLQRVRAVGESGRDRQGRRRASQPPPSRSTSKVAGDSVEREAEGRSRVALGLAGVDVNDELGQSCRPSRCSSPASRPGCRRRRRAHLERVRGLGQAAVDLRAGTRAPRSAVEPASKPGRPRSR